MNDSDGAAYSSAAHDSTVGIQAGVVHNSNVYFVHPDASPQDKYRAGVRLLEDGVPSRALEVITDAIAHGYHNAEVRFYWVLAMLSARTHHDLSTEEIQQLHRASGLVRSYPEGEWKEALRVAFDLLAALGSTGGATGPVLKQLQDLPSRQHDAILRHLDLMLTGGMKDDLWAETLGKAEMERLGNDRAKRVWAYFEPSPIGARAALPRLNTAAAAAAQAALPPRVALFVVSSVALGYLAWTAHPALAVIESLVALGAGRAAARCGIQWWGRQPRPDHTAGSDAPQPHSPAPPEGGFTNSVRNRFDHYFRVRTPHGFTPDAWLAHTAEARSDLAAEIADLYRERRIAVDRVNWLIRYLAEETRNRHNNGTLFDRHPQDQTPIRTKVLTVAALAVCGATVLAGLGTAVRGTVQPRPVWALLAFLGVAWSGHAATQLWLKVRRERHRLALEAREYQEELAARQKAHQRWKALLDETRPSELEMETWLACDKTSFIDEALRHHRLTWRDLITHTILVAPARPYKRARVQGGPWRYSHYVIRLFLFTRDGIREVSSELKFSDSTRRNEQRSNYRFDALSSVQVTENADAGYDLELVLTNGPARKIRVKDADAHQLAPDENAREISEISLSTAGFTHTFRLLEGIAADGKGWLERHNPDHLTPFQIVD
ncbi:hypothetical protein JHN55_00200 [Streptomyces sp. MBT56]|uniref:hypothetical protein n=1 Tax=unclassified Streptomyces TaxID=2593676 RepID=UPI00190E085D|nr:MULTISPECIES: hypothetical protein [unclassified Streptomyces]MBK3554985.1 hypothetical protein [Streptomyces sp. MBT56]MBK3601189.1 hypothetical protein [Streptomyces sp. MBT54]MBK3615059.1 hypothetical protein [Streptomyces sp. MBT98]